MITKLNNNNSIPVKIEYILANDILTSVIDNNKITIVLKIGASWKEIENTLFSQKIKENQNITKFGAIPNFSFEFSIPGDTQEQNEKFLSLLNARLIFMLTFADGLVKILGNKNKPCYVSFDSTNEMLPETKISIQSNQKTLYLAS